MALVAALALVAAVGVGVSGADGRFAAPAWLAEVTGQNASLRAEIEKARMELEMERATRAELQRQIDGMGAQIAELNHQLEFLNSRNVKPTRMD